MDSKNVSTVGKRQLREEQLSPDTLIEMLRRMLLVRAFDGQLPSLYTRGLIRGSSHSSIGQEAVAVGACFALEKSDYVTSTHRGHGHTIAKGGDIKRMMAELLGRANGYCRGKGGSMHIADFSIGMLGANGIVGGGIGIAVGAALSALLRNSQQVALCFFGDGAVNQGIFLEAGNMAAIWKLPVILLCENNQFAMSARPADMTSVPHMVQRARAIGIPSFQVDGSDVVAVFDLVKKVAAQARRGGGPFFVEATCYRYEGHFSGDTLKYRSKEELSAWKEKDPILSFTKRLIEEKLLTEGEADELTRQVDHDVDEAIKFAMASPFPEPTTAWEDLYA